MHKNFIRLFFSILLLSSLSISSFAEGDSDTKIFEVKKLLGNLDSYNGKTVSVRGYAHIEFEGNTLYQTTGELNYKRIVKAIYLEFEKDLPDKKFDGKEVVVSGVFSSDDNGHMGLFPAAIKVKEIKLLK